MPKGMPSIDLKKDETRTVRSKMGVRATYAGKRRNHALAVEGAKEVRMLENERRIVAASMTKDQREMKKKMLYLKNLLDERKLSVSEDGGAVAEDNDDSKENGPVPATAKPDGSPRREYPYKPDTVNSSKDLKTIEMSKKARDMYLKRTLHELQSSYTISRDYTTLNELRLQRMKENISKMGRVEKKGLQREKSMIRKTGGKSENGFPNAEMSGAMGSRFGDPEKDSADNVFLTKGHVPTHLLNFPEIPRAKTGSSFLTKKASLSQMISSGHFTALPAIQDHRHVKSSPAVDSVTTAEKVDAETDGTSSAPPPPPTGKPQGKQSDLLHKKTFVPLIGPPVPYYQAPVKENPFATPGGVKTDILRSRDLIDHRKSDEMYVWLGFETEKEFLEHQRQGKGKSVLTVNSIDAVIDEEGERESDGDEDENESDEEKEDDSKELTRGRSFVRQPSKLGKPVSLMAEAVQPDPFVKAATAVLIVRQFQMNVKS